MSDPTYETGVFIAFCLWLYSLVMTIVRANSLFAQNLRKVNMRLSWSSGQPVPAEDRSSWGWVVFKIFWFFGVGLLSTLLSWLSVLWFVGAHLYQWHKQSGMPAGIKELRWKMRNIELTQEQVTATLQQAAELVSTPTASASATR